jgi:hypothetical protein
MRAHITELCERNEIQVSWCRRTAQAYSVQGADDICIAPVKSKISYAVALHEIGHVLGPHQNSKHSAVRERGAWRRAKANALQWDAALERYAAACLAALKP